jgi:hypothetical protein
VPSMSGRFPSTSDTSSPARTYFGRPRPRIALHKGRYVACSGCEADAQVREDARHYLVYSDTTNDASYYVRQIGIDDANKVCNIVAGFYWD